MHVGMNRLCGHHPPQAYTRAHTRGDEPVTATVLIGLHLPARPPLGEGTHPRPLFKENAVVRGPWHLHSSPAGA